MPFGDDLVEITYQANVQGIGDVQALAAANQEVQATTTQYSQKVNEATIAQQKNNNVLLEARSNLRLLHRELYIFLATAAGLKILASSSESLAAAFERSGRSFQDNFLKPLGDGLASILNSTNSLLAAFQKLTPLGAVLTGLGVIPQVGQKPGISNLTIKDQIAEQNLLADVLRLRGDEQGALEARLQGERIRFNDENRKRSATDQATFLAYFNERAARLKEENDLAILGLETQQKIVANLRKDLVSGFQSDTGSIIGDFIAGKAKTGAEMIQMFRDTLGKSFGDAISKSLFTATIGGKGFGGFFDNIKNFLTGKDPEKERAEKEARDAASKAQKAAEQELNNQKEMLDVLRQIARCTCSAAQSANATFTATITPSKESTLSKIGGVLGAIGSLSSLNFGKLKPPGVPPGVPPGGIDYRIQNPGVIIDVPKRHSGGFVGSFQSGGEVPIMAMPGEFVVRRPAAMANKNLLEQINASGKPQHGTQGSVFVINANDAKSFSDMLSTPSARAMLEIQIIRAISNNGSLRDIIKNYAR